MEESTSKLYQFNAHTKESHHVPVWPGSAGLRSLTLSECIK